MGRLGIENNNQHNKVSFLHLINYDLCHTIKQIDEINVLSISQINLTSETDNIH